ncbi:hypothetical protein [Nonomuraea phyllanthi]|uniref:hypothetical protein n=1 Tax=Nonomuraea phyllanthi TaxID=2219224 RepID=UPI00129365FF|nr:hypothetical protein [Nonomuraea phyllanthi]
MAVALMSPEGDSLCGRRLAWQRSDEQTKRRDSYHVGSVPPNATPNLHLDKLGHWKRS